MPVFAALEEWFEAEVITGIVSELDGLSAIQGGDDKLMGIIWR